jgi:hypothetical protein
MNWISNKTMGLAATGWLVVSAVGQMPVAAAPATSSPPPEIKLNGLTTILGDKRALFKVRLGSGPVESYCLAEGQSAGCIKLLSVDVRAGRIKVNYHGVIQTVSLCDAPDLSILTATEAGGDENGNSLSLRKNAGTSSGGGVTAASPTTGGVTAGQNIAAAVPAGKSTAGAANSSPGTAASSNSGTSDAGSQNSSGSGDASSSNTSQRPEPYSLTAAREFERIRIETASGVYNGTDEPLPLTPLTPPGTPKALIGPDRAWFPD